MREAIAARYGFEPFAPPDDAPAALRPILARSVCRRFRDRDVSEALLDLVLAGAQSAPSKSDLQQYAIVAIRDAARRRAVADAIGTMGWIADAPVLLLFCADLRRGRAIGARRGLANRNDNLDSFLNAGADAALALGFCIMAADAAGLGSCPVSSVRDHLDLVRELCALPPGVFPLAGLAVGWPEAREPVSARLPPAAVLHRERYDAAAADAALADYDARRPRAKGRYPEVHGPAPAGCTWTENAARQLAVPERAGFRDWLRAHGTAAA